MDISKLQKQIQAYKKSGRMSLIVSRKIQHRE
jgi:hypothetical protein